MLLNEFCQLYFKPASDNQMMLVESIKQMRLSQGAPHKYKILRSVAKTRKYTRSTYPPGWKYN
jgi:hypothetical protein